MERMAKLGEMRDGTWSIHDCLDACELLDYRDEVTAAANKAAAPKVRGA